MKAATRTLQWTVVLGLAAAYFLLVLLLAHRLPSRSLYSPIAYLALVLSALWWGKRGALLAMVLAVMGLLPHFWQAPPDPWGDAARTASFLIVAFGLGAVRDRAVAAFAAQRRSERKYQDMVEKSLAGIFVYRGERVLFSNSRLRTMLGLEPEDIVGVSFWTLFCEEDKPKVQAQLAECRRTGGCDLHYECRLRRKDGSPVWVDIVNSVVEYEGAPAVMVSAYDISEQKMVEEKRRELSKLARRQEEQLVHSTRLAEMGEMAAGIAHEINQPLTGIKNYAKNAMFMLEEGAGDLEEIKNNLQLICGQVDRASRIIGQMRELAHRTERHFAPVDVNQKLRETVEFVMPQLRLSGVDVDFSPAATLPRVMGDGIRLEQVFLNLLTNARQAMEDAPHRRLTISTRTEANSEWPVVIEISDTGKGFPPETASKLFAPFYTTKQARHGTGLGLSISLSIIKDHQGTIEAVGAEGQGATFTVRLPALAFDEAPAPIPKENAVEQPIGKTS